MNNHYLAVAAMWRVVAVAPPADPTPRRTVITAGLQPS